MAEIIDNAEPLKHRPMENFKSAFYFRIYAYLISTRVLLETAHLYQNNIA